MPAHAKPTALKVLHGARKAAINKNEPRISELAVRPRWLPKDAKKEWKRLIDGLGSVELVTAADQALMEAYCVAYVAWRKAEQILQREGQTYQEPIMTRSGNFTGRYRLKRHPALSVAKDRATEMITVLRRFGLPPSERHRFCTSDQGSIVPPFDDDDDFEVIDTRQQ